MKSSKPDQPNKQAEFMDFFKTAFKTDGTIDHRSAYGRQLRSIREDLAADQYQAARRMIEKDIAFYITTERALKQHLFSDQKKILTKRGLTPLITRDLVRIQEAKRKAIRALLDLNKKQKASIGGKSGDSDLDNLFDDD